MNQFIMTADDPRVVKFSLPFKFTYPFYKTPTSALNRFEQLHVAIKDIEKTKQNAPLIKTLYNECDYILNTLEGYDL